MGCHAALLALLLGMAGGHEDPQQDLKKILERSPGVVALRNAEGHGTGLILDDSGLILTNAHVVASPLILQAVLDSDGRTRVYNRVSLIGIHPRYDLALVRIDPQEHGAKLSPVPLAAAAPGAGQPAYAMGFPMSLGKAISAGSCSGKERVLNDLAHLEFTAQIYPGNSGGPVFDKEGRAFGVVTYRVVDDRPTALAVPLAGFRADHFISWGRRPRDPSASDGFVKAAEKQFQAGNLPLAVALYHAAIVRDLANPDLYFRMGMIYRRLGRDPLAAAYLVRSLQLDPWSDEGAERYLETGFTLLRLGKIAEARLAWEEAAMKYPDQSGRIWTALAEFWWSAGNALESAYATRVAIKVTAPDGPQMNELYKRARAALPRDQERVLFDRQVAIDAMLQERKDAAGRARRRGQEFLIQACERLVRDYEGVQREARNVDFSALPSTFSVAELTPLSAEEVARLFTRTRILVARELATMGIKDRAVDALEELVSHYSARPEIWEARNLLAEWKRAE